MDLAALLTPALRSFRPSAGHLIPRIGLDMKLSKEQVEQLQEALLSGYDEPMLQMMLRVSWTKTWTRSPLPVL